eukprot:m.886292 g.886292  ORF g.886292 m.886292 type:complete len:2020 (+) comp59908_c0_seq2:178-6237(+)
MLLVVVLLLCAHAQALLLSRALFANPHNIAFTAFDTEFAFTLQQRTLAAHEATFGYVGGSEGEQKVLGTINTELDGAFYTGHDQVHAGVVLSLHVRADGRLSGAAADVRGGPIAFELRSLGNSVELTFINQSSLPVQVSGVSFDSGGVGGEGSSFQRRSAPQGPEYLYCDVYLDISSSFYQAWSDGITLEEKITSVVSRALTIFSLTTAIFDANFNQTTLALVAAGVTVFTDVEFVPSSISSGAVLSGYGNFLANQSSGLAADVRNGAPRASQVCLNHLFVNRSFNNSVIGLANVGTACESTLSGSEQNGYAAKNIALTSSVQGFGSLISSARTAAHEIGHNFNASHDDPNNTVCTPPQAPFLMAAALNLGDSVVNLDAFSPCSVAAILGYAQQRGGCLKTLAQVSTTAPTRAPTTSQTATVTTMISNGWMVSNPGSSCSQTCPSSSCHEASQMSLQDVAQFAFVHAQLGGSSNCSVLISGSSPEHPSYFGSTCLAASGPSSSCSAVSVNRRLCCCSSSGCPTLPSTTPTASTTTTTGPPKSGWVASGAGASCQTACSGRCHLPSMNNLSTTFNYNTVLRLVLGDNAPACSSFAYGDTASPAFTFAPSCHLANNDSLCSKSTPGRSRLCCCGDQPCSNKPAVPPSGWVLGIAGRSCDDSCPANSCNATSMNEIGSISAFESVLDQMFPNSSRPVCARYTSGSSDLDPAYKPQSNVSGTCSLTNGQPSCNLSYTGTRRMCCCKPGGCATQNPEKAEPTIPKTGWVIGAVNDSCSDACGGPCHLPSMNALALSSNFTDTMTFLLGTNAPTCYGYYSEESGPSFSQPFTCTLSNGHSQCSWSALGQRRVCCCGGSECNNKPPVPPSGWVMSMPGKSCDYTCPAFGCNATSMAEVASISAFESVQAHLARNGTSFQCLSFATGFGAEDPSVSTSGSCKLVAGLPTCAGASKSSSRLCCCKPEGCSTIHPAITTTPAPKIGWVVSETSMSCSDACSGPCYTPSMNAMNTTFGYSTILNLVLGDAAPKCSAFYSGGSSSPAFNYAPYCTLSNGQAKCSWSNLGSQRLCCCGDSACPTRPAVTPSGWVLGALGKSCMDTCPVGLCNSNSSKLITNATVFEDVRAHIYGDAAPPACSSYNTTGGAQDPSYIPATKECRFSASMGTLACTGSSSSARRICCCNPLGCPITPPLTTSTTTVQTSPSTTFTSTRTTTSTSTSTSSTTTTSTSTSTSSITSTNPEPSTSTTSRKISEAFVVVSEGSAGYNIDSKGLNLNLTLVRGRKYQFIISAPDHPFWIKTARTAGSDSASVQGVVGNGATSGVLSFDVPLDCPDTLYYVCEHHVAMSAAIVLIDESASSTLPWTTALPLSGWVVGREGDSCWQTCRGSCHLDSMTKIANVAAFRNILAVVGTTQPNCAVYQTNLDVAFNAAPAFSSQPSCYLSNMATTCESALPGFRRICCCGSQQCITVATSTTSTTTTSTKTTTAAKTTTTSTITTTIKATTATTTTTVTATTTTTRGPTTNTVAPTTVITTHFTATSTLGPFTNPHEEDEPTTTTTPTTSSAAKTESTAAPTTATSSLTTPTPTTTTTTTTTTTEEQLQCSGGQVCDDLFYSCRNLTEAEHLLCTPKSPKSQNCVTGFVACEARCSVYLGYECQAVGSSSLGGVCCPATECPPCPSGYVVDANGCRTCTCKPCPSLAGCQLTCPFGFELDALSGCRTCRCRSVCWGTLQQSSVLTRCGAGSPCQSGRCEYDSSSDTGVCCPEGPAQCSCNFQQFHLVCGSDGRTYQSPCIAGCHGISSFTGGVCPADACSCPATYQPVCGENGVTYGNPCLASCSRVSSFSMGTCGGLVPGPLASSFFLLLVAPISRSRLARSFTDRCFCPFTSNPVCANGRTYENDCLARCAGSCTPTPGPCPGSTCTCAGPSSPVCGSDGYTYVSPCNAQCHGISTFRMGSCHNTMQCATNYFPVCGNGENYDNPCLARKAGVDFYTFELCENDYGGSFFSETCLAEEGDCCWWHEYAPFIFL